MNRIFKSIWNAQTRTFVAVSELTAARGKPVSSASGAAAAASGTLSLRTLCAALLGTGLLTAGLATAQQITIGDQPPVAGDSILFSTPGSIQFQNGGTINGLTDGAMTAGSTQAVTGGQLFQVNTTLGGRIDGLTTDLTSLGTDLTDVTTRVTTVEGSVGSLTNRVTTTEGNVGSLTTRVTTTEGNVGSLTTRVTTTEGNVTTVTGRLQALEDQLYTAGDGVKYFRVNSSLADASATGTNALAAGPLASAAGASSTAIGQAATTTATATSGIALGQNATVGTAGGSRADGVASVAIGRNSRASGNGTVALGDGAVVDSAFVDNAMALGTGARVTGQYSSGATALGANALASAVNATALGSNAQALADNTIALGNAQANADNALAGGNGAVAAAPDSIALGTGAGVGTTGSAGLDRTSHVAIGTRAGQDVVGNQTVALGFESGSEVTGDWNIGIGAQAGTGLTGDENVAMGYQANRSAGAVNHATAVGSRANAGTDAVALGYRAQASSHGSIAVGTDAVVSSGLGVALGRGASAAGDNVALGANSSATPADVVGTGYLTGSNFTGGTVVSVGNATTLPGGLQRRIVNLADGSQATDAVNVRQLRSAQQSVANLVGNVPLNADGTYGKISVADANNNVYEFDTVSEALNVLSSGTINILPSDAVRYNTTGQINNLAAGTLGTDAVNVEQLNEVVARNGMRYVSVNATGLANEDNAGATGANAVAIGPEAVAAGASATALGFGAVAQSNQAAAVGNNAQALGLGSSVLGNDSTAYDVGSVAIGREATSRGENSLVMGTGAQADQKTPNDTVNNAIVIGTVAEVTADDGIAVGRSALASQVRGIAQGTNAHSEAVDATAIGTNALATGTSAYASGTGATASGVNAIASGTNARGYATNAIAMGNNAISGIADPDPDQVVNNINTVAIGASSRADARNATAVGRQAQATGQTALAIGDNTRVSGTASNAVGSNNQVIGAQSGVLGNDNQLATNNAFIIGNNGSVTVEGGVAIGSASVSNTGANRAGYVPNAGNPANTTRVNATTSTTGAVAVGSSTLRRQITGLAAGTADSDAVNVAQLKSTGWNVQTDGDTPNHVSTGEGHTVDIGLAPGETNLTVRRTTTAAGLTTIDYALAKNLDLGTAGSVKTGNSVLNNAGLTVNNGTQITTQIGAGNISVTNGTNTVTVNSGTGTVNGLTNRTFNPDAIVNGQAATEDQLRQVRNTLTTDGFGLTGQDGNTVRADLGGAVPVVGGDTNVTTRVEQGQLQVRLADNVTVNNNLSVGGNTTMQGNLGVTGMSTLTGGAVIGNSLTVNPNTTVNMGGNRVRGVAAGVDGTDAVNVSQLNAVSTRPLTFTGNSGSVERVLGQTLAIEGGLANTATASSANLRTRVDAATGRVVLEMANDLTADSLTINNGGPALSGTGLAMADQQITGLADGTSDDHAVNLGQLKNVQQTANAGWNLGTNGDPATNVAPNATVNLANTDGNVVLTQTGTDVTFDLADDVAVNNNLTVGGNTTMQGNLGVTGLSTLTGGAVIGNSLTVNPNTTVTMGGNRINDVAAGVDDTDAVNVSQLNAVSTRPLTFTGNSGSVERILGQTLAIEGGLANTATASSANLRTRVDAATGTVVLEMANDLTADSLTINNGGPVLNGDGLAMADKQITGLADGTSDDHAVNLGQLKDVEQTANAGWNLGTNGDPATNVAPGGTVNLANTDGNIVLTQNGTDVAFDLANDVAVNNNLTVGGATNLGSTLNVTGATSLQSDLAVAGNSNLQGALNVTGLSTLTGGAVIGNSLTVNPNTTVSMGGNRINDVAAGVDDTDAVNVSQLNAVSNRPLTFTGNTGSVDRILGETLAIEGGLDSGATASSANLRTRVDAATGTVVLEMANNLTADSLTINNGGPTLNGNGLDMADKQITGLADGTADDHAVNLGQLKDVEETANKGWNLGTNGDPATQVKPGDSVNLANTDGNVVLTQTGTDVSFDLADDVKVKDTLTVAGNTTLQSNLSVAGNTTMQGNLGVTGLTTLTGGAVIGSSLTVNPNTTVDMGGNKITNIAPGTQNGDAVAYEQLTEVALTPITFTGNTGSVERMLGQTLAIQGGLDTAAAASGENLRTRVVGETVQLEMAEDLMATSLTIRNGGPRIHSGGIAMGGQQITGLAAGTEGDHAVNLSQLRSVQDTAEQGWNLGTNGGAPVNVAPGANVDFSSADGNIGIAQDGTQVRLRLSDSIAINNNLTVGGNTTINGYTTLAGGVTISNQFLVSPGTTINMGGNRIQNVAPGVNSTDAVNVGQLEQVQTGVDRLKDRAVVYDGNVGDPKDRVTLEGDRSTDGGRTGGTTITNLARGEISATSTDAVNGSQIHDMGTDIANGMGGDSTFVDGRLVTKLNVGGNTYNNVNDALTGVNNRVDNVSEVASRGWDLQVNGDTASQVAPGSTVQFVEGENVTITRDGLNVTVDVARDLKVDTVTAGEIAVENGPTINREGLDMVNQRIRNVADGVGPGDAVNVNQLNRLADGMNQQVNRLDARINLAEKRADAGVAAAMASATLPQAYLPGKSMFALGGGTWNGETGFAMGLSTVSDNGKWLVKGTGAGSSRGDYGAAVGVGYQW